MKFSELLVSVLEDNPEFKELSKPQKLIAKATIKRMIGKEDGEVPEDEVENMKLQLGLMLSATPLVTEQRTSDGTQFTS